MSNTYGYIRVSTQDQNEARQVDAMLKVPISKENLFIDKASGKDFDRVQYVKMIHTIRKGDTVYIHSLDRLGRNYEGIISEWNAITKKIGADIVVLDMPILDTRRGKDLLGTLISDIVLQLLSYVAQTEREKIKTRQAEGIAAAKARGVKFGKPRIQTDGKYEVAFTKWLNGEIDVEQAAQESGLNISTFRCRAYRDKKNIETKKMED